MLPPALMANWRSIFPRHPAGCALPQSGTPVSQTVAALLLVAAAPVHVGCATSGVYRESPVVPGVLLDASSFAVEPDSSAGLTPGVAPHNPFSCSPGMQPASATARSSPGVRGGLMGTE